MKTTGTGKEEPITGERRSYLWRVIGLHSAGPAILTIVLFFIMNNMVFIPAFRDNLMNSKRETARELTNTVWNLLNDYYMRAVKGELSPEEARRRARERIRMMRYGPEDKDYFWINDMRPYMVMHPYRTELEGKDLGEYVDTEGKKVFIEFVKTVKEHNAGFVEYRWQWKDDPSLVVPKVSYVRLFRPWEWIVGTGVYIRDVEEDILMITRHINLITSGILLLIVLLSGYIIWHHRRTELERLKAESRLMESEEKYRFLVENMNDGLVIIDAVGKIVYVNAKMCEMTGYEQQEITGRNFLELFNRENVEIIKAELEKRKRGEYSPYEVTITGKRGNRVICIVSPRPLYDKEGNYNGSFGVVTDITGRIRAEEEKKELQLQLIQTQKLDSIGKLAGGIAHDFNNILTVINGHAQMAIRRIEKLDFTVKEKLLSDVRAIDEAGVRAARLIRQLLVFSKKQALESVVIDVNSAIGNLMQMLLRLIGEDIRVETSLISHIPCIKGDPAQLEQVLINLIVNARDSIAERAEQAAEKKITIKTDRQYVDRELCMMGEDITSGEYVVLSISDTGIGMTAEVMERIFEPFFTTKNSGKGTGLGLAIVYAIIQRHHGCLQVASSPGQGSTFTVYLPVCSELIPGEQETAGSELILSGDEDILLVEDDGNVRAFTESVLAEYGYRVHSAANGIEALTLIERVGLKPDLLLTDMIMPEMDGLELAEKYLRLFPASPVIMMSGYTDRDMASMENLGDGISFLHKPYSIRKLMELIREKLGLSGKAY